MKREKWNDWMLGKWKNISDEMLRRMWREGRDCSVDESGVDQDPITTLIYISTGGLYVVDESGVDQDPITADAILREAWECLVGEEAAERRRAAEAEAAERRRAAEAEAAEAEAVRRNAELILAIEEGVVGKLRAEFLRLLNDGLGAVAEWKGLQAELGFVSLPDSYAVNRPTLACAECAKMFRPRPVRCPECGSEEIAEIWYGYYPHGNPDKDGWVVLGGCVVGPYRLSCRGCGHEFGKVRL